MHLCAICKIIVLVGGPSVALEKSLKKTLQFLYEPCLGFIIALGQSVWGHVIHESTVSRKVITWANYLYFFLGAQPIWPSKEAVQKHLPQEFRVLYRNTRVVIDCTKIRVQVPSSLL